jgi:hypothetical protein
MQMVPLFLNQFMFLYSLLLDKMITISVVQDCPVQMLQLYLHERQDFGLRRHVLRHLYYLTRHIV